MRNPSRKPQPPSWREIVLTVYRAIGGRRDVGGSSRKKGAAWIAAGFLCVALAAGISLARHAVKKDSIRRRTASPLSDTISAKNTENDSKNVASVEAVQKPETRNSSGG